jgi:restriction endonuclease Mrr
MKVRIQVKGFTNEEKRVRQSLMSQILPDFRAEELCQSPNRELVGIILAQQSLIRQLQQKIERLEVKPQPRPVKPYQSHLQRTYSKKVRKEKKSHQKQKRHHAEENQEIKVRPGKDVTVHSPQSKMSQLHPGGVA